MLIQCIFKLCSRQPVASDLLQGNLTLPAIMLKEQHPDDNPVSAIFDDTDREKNLGLALDMIRNSDIVPDCYRVAQSFAEEACRALDIFPDNDCKRSLVNLAEYVVERQH